MGYSPLAAGAASLPVTALMLALSARSGALAQRIGPRIPLTAGPLVIAAAMLLMTTIDPGDSYLTGVLPAVVLFGLGLTLVVAPVTSTVLAAADARHAGVASGVNNAVSRVAGLLAVAVLPAVAGITGERFYDAGAMADGFATAMVVCAILAAGGGVLAWATIRRQPPAPAETHFSCAVAGTPLRPPTAA
jgi:Na+/melibiose symporter-like transporter